MATILSWNVNGLRAAIRRGSLRPLGRYHADVVCFQEVKAAEQQVGRVMRSLPHQYFATTVRPG